MELYLQLKPKSVGRVDKKQLRDNKDKQTIEALGLQNFENEVSQPIIDIRRSIDLTIDDAKVPVCMGCGRVRSWKTDGKPCKKCGHDHVGYKFEYDDKLKNNLKFGDVFGIFFKKAGTAHIPDGAERFSYTPTKEWGIIYIPINRLRQIYQTDKALNQKTVQKKANAMKAGKKMPPVQIGYNYDVQDGHHSWHAAMLLGYTHVPCEVVGDDQEKIKEAKAKYREVWKSEFPDLGDSLAFVIDLQKAELHKGKLVKRRTAVRGKNGKVFYRMQWVDPHANIPGMEHPGKDESTYAHHEDGIKDMERQQSNRFPVMRMPVKDMRNTQHNYSTDRGKYLDALKKYHAGEKLPPVKVSPSGEILSDPYLVDMAKNMGLTHVPVVVVGNPNQKKALEDKLKDEVLTEEKDEQGSTQKMPVNIAEKPKENITDDSSDIVKDINNFKEITLKKYPKEYLMAQAKNQGIKWNEYMNNGEELPKNSNILWMRAYQSIMDHIKSGKHFEIAQDKKQIDKKMEQEGKDSVHSHFLELLQKFNGDKKALMQWAKDNGIGWKEKADPDMNWMYAVMAIKGELSKGKMLMGIRTRQKEAMEQANLYVSDQIKDRVKAYGQKYGKSNVMKRAGELGIAFDRFTKHGDALPENSNILWMRAHEAISEYVAKGNDFKMSNEPDTNTGIKATVGDNGSVNLSRVQGEILNWAKRNTHNLETATKNWAIKALSLDRGISEVQSQDIYNKFMENARNSRFLVHFDPLEKLPSGVNLIDQLISDGEFKNDFYLNRGYDREAKEAIDCDMFGDIYREGKDSDSPNYGVIDLYNRGLKSHPYGGSVAFVLKNDAHKRSTGSHVDAEHIPYGEDGKTLRSLEDPHQLLADRWMSRWKQPNKPDAQRKRAMDAIINGKPYMDDSKYYEAHLHGGLNFQRDVDHILVPQEWENSDNLKKIKELSDMYKVPIRYDGGDNK